MRRWTGGAALAGALLLAGCGQNNAELERQVAQMETRLASVEEERETLRTDFAALEKRADDLEAENKSLKASVSAQDESLTLEDVRGEIAAEVKRRLDDRLAAIRTAGGADQPAKPAEGADPGPDPAPEAAETTPGDGDSADTGEPDEAAAREARLKEVKERLAELMPLAKTNPADRATMEETVGLLWEADAETRAEMLKAMEDYVRDHPDDLHGRMALAKVRLTTIVDAKTMMEQGQIATEAIEEGKTLYEENPDFYDAVHFVATLKPGFPTFTQEFKTAQEDLDRALEMQKEMIWEDRFAEIHASYAEWYYKQKKYDDAAKWVDEGLAKKPAEGYYLDELNKWKERIEEAQVAESDEG